MGEAIARLGLVTKDDRIEVPGGVVGSVCAPESVESMCDVVRAAATDRAGLLVVGGRTRLGVANATDRLALAVSTEALGRVLEFEPEEGVVRAAAGARIGSLRATVTQEGWELPLDAPDDATVGGTIATASTGPRAHLFGPVKDAILGLDVVGGDGVATRCGGRVVKNVTGYDMAKLYCGSFGSLAIVTSAWLRLRPQPAVRRAFAGALETDRAGLERLRRFAVRPSVRALVGTVSAGAGPSRFLLELGGAPESVAADASALAEQTPLEEVAPALVDGDRERRARPEAPFAARMRVLGSRLHEMVELVREAGLEAVMDVGLGVIHASGALENPTLAAMLRERAVQAGGHLCIEKRPGEWLGEIDAFGDLGGTASTVRTLKDRFDPAGILNPGRFVTATESGTSR